MTCRYAISRINEDFKCGYQGEYLGTIRGNTYRKKVERVRDVATLSALSDAGRQPQNYRQVFGAQ